MSLLLHNWRVANYVNNSSLAEGQYGYPAEFGFVPSRQLRCWQDFDNEQDDDLVTIPPEVTVGLSARTREIHLTHERAFHTSTYPLTLQPLGAEYWVARSDPAIWAANQDLVIRVSPESVHRLLQYFGPSPTQTDARLMASVITYAPPNAQVATARLWEHPEWATGVIGPQGVDVDSIASGLELVVPDFGGTVKAAVIVLSLVDGPNERYSGDGMPFGDYVEALRYRVDLAIRPYLMRGPNPVVFDTYPSVDKTEAAWSPEDTVLVYTATNKITPGAGQFLFYRQQSGWYNILFIDNLFDVQAHPDWSPRGDWIVCSVRGAGATTENLWLASWPSGEHHRLTFVTPSLEMRPAFQPNGQRVAYTRQVTGNTTGAWELRLVDLSGGNDGILVSRGGATLGTPRWSPDAKWVYFTANDSLYAVGVEDGNRGNVLDLRWRLPVAKSFDLPLGKNPIAIEQAGTMPWYRNCRTQSSGCFTGNLLEWTPQTDPYRRIALFDTTLVDTIPRFYRTGASFRTPRWSHDGTRIAYSSSEFSGDQDVLVGRTSFNSPPKFNASTPMGDADIFAGFPYTFSVGASDPDGEAVSYEAVCLPPGATFSPSGVFSWPQALPLGAEYFVVFRAKDPSGGVDNRVVRFRVVQGGGGGCPFLDTRTAEGWTVENSVLGRSASGQLMTDWYRLKEVPLKVENTYRLRLRENEQEYTTLDRVRLLAFDHDPGGRVFSDDNGSLLGVRMPAARVTTANGTDITALLRGDGAGFIGEPGETLFVKMQWATLAPILGAQGTQDCGCPPGVVECGNKEEQLTWHPGDVAHSRPTGVARDQSILDNTGILVQVQDGNGGWKTVRHTYPREDPDEALVDSIGNADVRMVFVGQHRLNFVGWVRPANAVTVSRILTLATARHSRLGDVKGPLDGAGGGATVIAPGDTLQLTFDAPPLAAGQVRDFYFTSNGVYSSAPPTRLYGTQDVPIEFALLQNRPNPFVGMTSISFDVPVKMRVRLEVFDLSGRRIVTLADKEYEPGRSAVSWNKRDEVGNRVSPSVYLYRMVAGAYHSEKKMTVLP